MPRDSNHNYNVKSPFKSLSLSHTHCSFFIYILFMDGSLLHLVILTANCFTFNEYPFQCILWHCFLFLESHLLSLRQIMLWEGSDIPVILRHLNVSDSISIFLRKLNKTFPFFFFLNWHALRIFLSCFVCGNAVWNKNILWWQPSKCLLKKKNLIDLRYLLLAVRIFNLPPFPGLWRGLVQLIHAEVTRIFITFPSGRGLVQTRIPSVISVRVVISLGVRFSLKMKIIW